MTNQDHNAVPDWRAMLAERAAQDAAERQASVADAIGHLAGICEAADAVVAEQAEIVRQLPPLNKETLGPLWPGSSPRA